MMQQIKRSKIFPIRGPMKELFDVVGTNYELRRQLCVFVLPYKNRKLAALKIFF